MHYPVPVLCLYRYFLAVPDATPYSQPGVLEFEILHMETENLFRAQAGPGQRSEQNAPLTFRLRDNRPPFVLSKETAVS